MISHTLPYELYNTSWLAYSILGHLRIVSLRSSYESFVNRTYELSYELRNFLFVRTFLRKVLWIPPLVRADAYFSRRFRLVNARQLKSYSSWEKVSLVHPVDPQYTFTLSCADPPPPLLCVCVWGGGGELCTLFVLNSGFCRSGVHSEATRPIPRVRFAALVPVRAGQVRQGEGWVEFLEATH